MIKAVLVFGNWIGGALVFIGSAILSQVTVDGIEKGVVGAAILGAGALIIRWVLKTSERVEEIWSNAVATEREATVAANRRADEAEHRRDEMTVKYDRERQLRMALEERGLINRRRRDADSDTV